MIALRVPRPPRAALAALGGAAFLAAGLVGVYRYLDNYWLYRGFAPPHDPAWVGARGTTARFYLPSPALGGRRQPVDVFLPPGYAAHPHRRYPVLYLLHGVPGRPGAFLATVRLGVVEDELVALHKARPLILAMPFGSTGSFTDEEWANGVRPHQGWATFVARDLVRAIDRRYRTIPHGWARGIAGLSEGGYGAINIALRHPREFRLVESWSGYERADDVGSIFGHRRSLLAANSPLDTLAARAAILRRRHAFVWFYSGSTDRFRTQNQAFAAALARARIPHRFFVVRGGHNWALWRDNAARAYLAASEHLGPTHA
ncbi:MAG TPA: alpha/beta hydrolase-fold protein [Gaiellaceae bacterium]|nr:alpha/beta hydrolase-fold protein [Gaiellaceae bacterium]